MAPGCFYLGWLWDLHDWSKTDRQTTKVLFVWSDSVVYIDLGKDVNFYGEHCRQHQPDSAGYLSINLTYHAHCSTALLYRVQTVTCEVVFRR